MDLKIKDTDKFLSFYSILVLILCFVCLFPEKIDAAYFPNFGYVGCYNYTNHMDRFMNFSAIVSDSTSVHSCIQICLKKYDNKYAGLMEGGCFCGDDYNQTFATSEKHCHFSCSDNRKCGGYGKMTIYNTDYDVKPLLFIPGNNTKFLEVWNRNVTMKFGNMFTGFVMRSMAIDWWNRDKLFHKPEYVSMMALNQHGQLLWAIDFFTNDTNANIVNWMTKDHVLPNEFINSSTKEKLKFSIKPKKKQILISDKTKSDHVWFYHGDVNNDKAYVTVVSPKQNALRVFYNKMIDDKSKYIVCSWDQKKEKCFLTLEKKECDCSNVVDGNCMRYFWNGKAVCPSESKMNYSCCECKQMGGSEDNVQGNTVFECKSVDLETCMENKLQEQCNEPCSFQFSDLQSQEPNYGMRRVQRFTLELRNKKYVTNFTEEKIICGIDLTSITNKTTKIEMIIADSDGETFPIDLSNDIGMKWFGTCYRAQKLTLNVGENLNGKILTLYEQAEDALLMVDRIAVLGFYHKEEPKKSKWEFLNDYPPEEVLNIMRPVLQKARSAGEVAVQNLSSSIRKKESATDFRKSSKGIGILGGCLLGLVFMIIFVSDVFIIQAHLKAMYRNIFNLFRPSPRVRVIT